MRGVLRKRGGLDDGCAGQVVVEDGVSVGLEDGFGGHCGLEVMKERWLIYSQPE